MNFPQRLLFFVIGIALGSVIAIYFIKQSRMAAASKQVAAAEVAPVGSEAMQRAAVSGVMRAYNERRVPMQSEFIHGEFFTEEFAAPGKLERYILLRGRGADQILGILEVTAKDADRVWGRVEEVRIFGADRLQVSLAPEMTREQFAAAIAPLGMRVIRGLPANSDDPSVPAAVATETGAIRMETPADIDDTNLLLVGFEAVEGDSVLKAQEALVKLDGVASVSLDYLDAGNRYTGGAK